MNSVQPSGVILTASPEDKKWGISVTFVTSIPVQPGGVYPPVIPGTEYSFSKHTGRVMHEYQVTFIAKGKGFFFSESTGRNNPIELHEGSVFLLFPGEWHNYYPDSSEGWLEYSIGFESEWFTKLVKNGFFTRQHPIYNVHTSETLRHLMETALKIAMRQYPGHQQLLSGILVHYLTHLQYLDKNKNFENSPSKNKMEEAKVIIESELQTITPEDLAVRLNMSYSSFRTLFKEYTGFPPAKYIAEIKILRAKDLLNCTSIPIKEISIAVGIENYEYFSTMFKANTGVSPSYYRSQIKLNKQ